MKATEIDYVIFNKTTNQFARMLDTSRYVAWLDEYSLKYSPLSVTRFSKYIEAKHCLGEVRKRTPGCEVVLFKCEIVSTMSEEE